MGSLTLCPSQPSTLSFNFSTPPVCLGVTLQLSLSSTDTPSNPCAPLPLSTPPTPSRLQSSPSLGPPLPCRSVSFLLGSCALRPRPPSPRLPPKLRPRGGAQGPGWNRPDRSAGAPGVERGNPPAAQGGGRAQPGYGTRSPRRPARSAPSWLAIVTALLVFGEGGRASPLGFQNSNASPTPAGLSLYSFSWERNSRTRRGEEVL